MDRRYRVASRSATPADYRAVSIDALREFARDESERTSLRQVAQAAGVGRTTLHKFIQEKTSPHPRVRRLLALWYLRERADVAERATADGYAGAMELLLAAFPEDVRTRAWWELMEAVERLHEAHGVPAPAALPAVRAQGPRTAEFTP